MAFQVVSVLAVLFLPCAWGGVASHGRILTRNMDTGTDHLYILQATTPAEFLEAISSEWSEIAVSDPVGRAHRLADEIAAMPLPPQVLLLQEVTTFSTGTLNSGVADTVVIDQLQSLLDGLSSHGLQYSVLYSLPETYSGAVPNYDEAVLADIAFLDHDAILVLTEDLHRVSNVQYAHYSNLLQIPTPVGVNVVGYRGYISFDVFFHGQTVRVFNTHLENFSVDLRVAQLTELIGIANAFSGPVVIGGDFNADANALPLETTLQIIIDAGFVDAFSAANPGSTASTWPMYLEDPTRPATPYQRIDFIFYRAGSAIGLEACNFFGGLRFSAPPALSSDHLGVVAAFSQSNR